ncbi:MAG: DUF748 domain-containing protein [gamma proteobacterium symbiont of Bathyaustriella thionipta]|nr:DUF748 domain-containing protein [gamma proteobacterium symbiont of Bathyaustriella thionipta]
MKKLPRFAKVLLVIAIILGVFVTLLPEGLRWYMNDLIHGRGGLGETADIDFNPANGQLTIKNLDYTSHRDNRIRARRLFIDIGVNSLPEKLFVIEKLELDDALLELATDENGKIDIGGWGDVTDQEASDESAQEATEWHFAVLDVNIKNLRIKHGSDRFAGEINFDQLTLLNLRNDEDVDAQINIQGQINQSRLAIEGHFQAFSATPTADIDIDLASMDLKSYISQLSRQLDVKKLDLALKMHVALEPQQDGSQQLSLSKTSLQGDIDLDLPEQRLALNHYSWQGSSVIVLNKSMQTENLDFNGQLALTDLAHQQGASQASVAQIDWQGRGAFAFAADGKPGKVNLKGNLDIAKTHWQDAAPQSLDAADIHWSGELDMGLSDNGMELANAGKFSLNDTHFKAPWGSFDCHDCNWEGQLGLQSQADSQAVNSDGLLAVKGIQVQLVKPYARSSIDGFQWKGKLSADTGQGAPQISLDGGVSIAGMTALPAETELQLMHFDQLKIQRLSGQPNDTLKAENISLINAHVFPQNNEDEQTSTISRMHFPAIDIDMLKYLAKGRIEIGKVLVDKPDLRIDRTKEGKLMITRIAREMSEALVEKDIAPQEAENEPEKNRKSDSAENHFSFALQELALKSPGNLEIEDRSFKPKLSQHYSVDILSVRDFDTSGTKPTQIELQLFNPKVAKINFQGHAIARSLGEKAEMKVKLSGGYLPVVSPYAERHIGYRLQKGGLSIKSSFKIDQRKIKGKARINVHDLTMTPVDKSSSEAMTRDLGLPLDTALSMMKDKNGQISLSIPISGDLDNPKFDPSDAINLAIGKAVKAGAITAVTVLLQPYGAIAAVASYANDELSRVQLEPVLMSAGSSQSDAKSKKYLAKLAALFKEKPQLAIQVCGVAVDADKAALQKQAAEKLAKNAKQETAKDKKTAVKKQIKTGDLLYLAAQRSEKLSAKLVDEFGVDDSNLLYCKPRVEQGNPKARPRVELSI